MIIKIKSVYIPFITNFKKIANGMACDVWIGKNKDQDEVFEWYFMADTWSSPFQAGKTTGFPVMTMIYSTVVAPKPVNGSQ